MGSQTEPEVTIEQIEVARALTLRHALLRPEAPGERVVHPADHDHSTVHLGAYRDSVLIGVATLVPPPVPGPGASFEVVSVAVEFGHRGRGVGALLINQCAAAASAEGAGSLTAAVSATAHGFFDHEGFGRVGDPYEAPDGSPHYRMVRPLDPA